MNTTSTLPPHPLPTAAVAVFSPSPRTARKCERPRWERKTERILSQPHTNKGLFFSLGTHSMACQRHTFTFVCFCCCCCLGEAFLEYSVLPRNPSKATDLKCGAAFKCEAPALCQSVPAAVCPSTPIHRSPPISVCRLAILQTTVLILLLFLYLSRFFLFVSIQRHSEPLFLFKTASFICASKAGMCARMFPFKTILYHHRLCLAGPDSSSAFQEFCVIPSYLDGNICWH